MQKCVYNHCLTQFVIWFETCLRKHVLQKMVYIKRESFVLQLIEYEENDYEFEKLNANSMVSSKKSDILKSSSEVSDEEIENTELVSD